MKNEREIIPRIVQLAQKVELDIQNRNLQAGDPYLTTAETARMLGVSTTIANRALQFLARSGRLVRKQRRGSFVAEPGRRERETRLARVHLVVHQHYMRTEGLLADGVIVGLQSELPGLDVSFNFMPYGGEREYVEGLVHSIMQSGQPEGLILVRASLEVQKLASESGLPAVVYGTPYRSIARLPYVDVDQYAMGQLLTEFALNRRAPRLFVIMRDRTLPGDTPYLNGIFETAGRAKMTADRIQIRSLARDRELVAAEVRDLLASSPARKGRPRAAILCRAEPHADMVLEELLQMGLKPGDDVIVAVSTIYRRGGERLPLIPYTQHAGSPIQIGEHLGRLLAACAQQSDSPESRAVVLPVSLQNGN